MRKMLMGALALGMLLTGATALMAQEAGMDAAAQEAMMKHMTPGPEHAMLAERVGNWTTKMKFWMAPGAPPMEAVGTTTYASTLGGRVLRGDHKVNMMGMVMDGVSLESYDNTRKVFNMIWTDNMSTGLTYGEGTYENEVMTISGKMADPSKGSEVDFRSVTKVESKDKAVMEMYLKGEGEEIKIFEITYERVP